ncbi:ATP-binding protein [Agromyces protaetiae]|uniref:ATP-binding protein n=1 Tax=Agromyces protaetiae TaxID=2509455 RepID=A0A4P6FF88_9MICO|nr:ATP-binding protein [Agromyces protaetiae]QAY74605.1 ATP-binding protein [Agromyces protaetiae]
MPPAEPRAARPVARRRSVTRAQVDTVASRALGVVGIVFSAQTVGSALDQSRALVEGAGIALMAVLYGAAVVLALATFTKVGVRSASLAYAIAYALALAAWPALVVDPSALRGDAPWLYFLCTVATTAAVVAASVGGAVGYTLAVPVLYGIIRITPTGGGASVLLAVFEAMYALILGVVVLVIITMLRQAAEAVDLAQDAALQRYDVAARQHANEIERVKVDALVHDAVLTTLLSAAAAETDDERTLAARMARDAERRLYQAGGTGPSTQDDVALTVLVRRLRGAMTTLTTPFTVRVVNAGGVELPVEAVEALYTAAVQAMVNSAQHAEHAEGEGRTTRRELRVRGVRARGCVIEVADSGVGFDPAAVPQERLGLRVSIEERMANAGGRARIDSKPGHGTTVTVAWPAEAMEGRA